MENEITTIRKGKKTTINIEPNVKKVLLVEGCVDFYLDALYLKYIQKYVGVTLSITYHNANGVDVIYSKTLEKEGVMKWFNTGKVNDSKFNFIIFSYNKELVFELSVGS